LPEAGFHERGARALDLAEANTLSADHSPTLEAENAAIAARAFRIAGVVVFLFQFLYLAADRATMPQYQHVFFPYYVTNLIDGMLAILVTYSRSFPRYWKPLALGLVGMLAATGAAMNLLSGIVTPQFYLIITFSFGCAIFALGRWMAERAERHLPRQLCSRQFDSAGGGALSPLSMDFRARGADRLRISRRVH
jgi:hypothetical protein